MTGKNKSPIFKLNKNFTVYLTKNKAIIKIGTLLPKIIKIEEKNIERILKKFFKLLRRREFSKIKKGKFKQLYELFLKEGLIIGDEQELLNTKTGIEKIQKERLLEVIFVSDNFLLNDIGKKLKEYIPSLSIRFIQPLEIFKVLSKRALKSRKIYWLFFFHEHFDEKKLLKVNKFLFKLINNLQILSTLIFYESNTDKLVFGPTIIPYETPCFECLINRLESNLELNEELNLLGEYYKLTFNSKCSPPPHFWSFLQGFLTVDITNLLNYREVISLGRIIVLDLNSLDIEVFHILPSPLCSTCSISFPLEQKFSQISLLFKNKNYENKI